ncbi:MAG: 50S ribosomal protein L3 [Spirochaetota bacterium]|nr:50S ribosomal protein L3 [Spirochaetota bacterium]
MGKALIGRKLGMSELFCDDGRVVPVTVCELGPCVVVQKKTVQRDGYSSIKLGYIDAKEKALSKPIMDDLKKKGILPKKIFREVDAFDNSLDVGSVITCNIFQESDIVNVTGMSKGKGFTGVVKRHGFRGGRKSHGSKFHRAPGSIGGCAYPGEVWKGKKLAGRHGNKKVTTKNLNIVKIFEDKNVVLISGAIPGRKNSIITVCERA